MKIRLRLLSFVLLAGSCTNIDDAKVADNKTFLKFYHGVNNYVGSEVRSIPGGYAVFGNAVDAAGEYTTILITTDSRGNQTGEPVYYPGLRSKAFQTLINGDALAGYVLLGDSIKNNAATDVVANIEVISTKVLKLNAEGAVVAEQRFKDQNASETSPITDYKSGSIQLTDAGDIIALGTFKQDLSSSEKPFIAILDNDLNIKSYKQHDLLDRNYVNAKSVYYKNGYIIWASAILRTSFNDSYLAIPYVRENSTFQNFSQLGETSTQFYHASDIHPSNASGYAVVGTKGQTDGTRNNIFFVRVDAQGNFIPNTLRFYDRTLSAGNEPVEDGASESEDLGEAVTATSDGFVIAGTTQVGNNSKDIYLIRVDAFGDILWNKTFGGDGDEEAVSVVAEDDGSIVVCGSNTLSGLSSILLLRVDSQGELKN